MEAAAAAGRAAVATELTENQLVTAPAVEPPEQKPPEVTHAYHRRFAVVYGLLGAAVLASIGGILLAARGGHVGTGPAAWSSWQPQDGGQSGAKQIAAHVAREYHLPSGAQLVEVFAKPPSVSPGSQNIPLHYVVKQGKGQNSEPIPISEGDTIQYSLCGLGDSCSIAKGTPSVQRGTLVRREILELALYTFKYMGGVKNVIAFMPPAPGTAARYTVFLQRGDVEQQLAVPLTQTLSPKTPLPNTISRREQQTIDSTTESKVFAYTLSQTQNGEAVLVLSPIAA
jgi:hypothetical protein